MDELNRNTKKSSKAMQEMEKRTRRFGSRMREIVTGALFFNLISRGMTSLVQWTSNVIKTNEEARASIAQLKGALLTLAQPILNVVIPAFIYLINILTRVVSAIASVVSRLFGTSAKASASAAKKLHQQAGAYGDVGKAAKEAGKSIMGFDELNVMQSQQDGGNAGGAAASDTIAPDFSGALSYEMQAEADKLTAVLSGALFALGVVLAFSGANIPLGIGMMAIGALGMYSVAALNWDSMSDSMKSAITSLLVWIGTGLLAIGAILAFSGANIGLGIGLMAAGAVALGSAAALNWNSMRDHVGESVTAVLTALGMSLLVLGALLTFSGANAPLGIGLMIAGGAALGSAVDLNWDYIGDALKGVWGNIKSWYGTNVAPKLTLAYWQGKLESIKDALWNLWQSVQQDASDKWDEISEAIRGGINGIIGSINGMISGAVGGINNVSSMLNSLSFQIPEWVPEFGGATFGMRIPQISAPQIPYLAQGAVIPPNREFLAVLGDQSSGNNIEAPEDLIRQIVREEAGSMSNDQLMIIVELIRQILSILGQDIDIRRIAQMITAQQRQAERARGW